MKPNYSGENPFTVKKSSKKLKKKKDYGRENGVWGTGRFKKKSSIVDLCRPPDTTVIPSPPYPRSIDLCPWEKKRPRRTEELV